MEWLKYLLIKNRLKGLLYANHKLRIKVAYNYIDTYTQEVIVDSSDFINSSTYGSESPYGSEITYGASNLYQIRLDFARQKCQSIKVSIEDIQADSGEALQLSNALFVVGTKSPDAKIDKSNGYGTK